jgi:hypothetical protein
MAFPVAWPGDFSRAFGLADRATFQAVTSRAVSVTATGNDVLFSIMDPIMTEAVNGSKPLKGGGIATRHPLAAP